MECKEKVQHCLFNSNQFNSIERERERERAREREGASKRERERGGGYENILTQDIRNH